MMTILASITLNTNKTLIEVKTSTKYNDLATPIMMKRQEQDFRQKECRSRYLTIDKQDKQTTVKIS